MLKSWLQPVSAHKATRRCFFCIFHTLQERPKHLNSMSNFMCVADLLEAQNDKREKQFHTANDSISNFQVTTKGKQLSLTTELLFWTLTVKILFSRNQKANLYKGFAIHCSLSSELFAFLRLLTVFLKRKIYGLSNVISRWQPDNTKTVAIDLALLNVLWDLIHWKGGLSSMFCGASFWKKKATLVLFYWPSTYQPTRKIGIDIAEK